MSLSYFLILFYKYRLLNTGIYLLKCILIEIKNRRNAKEVDQASEMEPT